MKRPVNSNVTMPGLDVQISDGIVASMSQQWVYSQSDKCKTAPSPSDHQNKPRLGPQVRTEAVFIYSKLIITISYCYSGVTIIVSTKELTASSVRKWCKHAQHQRSRHSHSVTRLLQHHLITSHQLSTSTIRVCYNINRTMEWIAVHSWEAALQCFHRQS